MPAMTAPDRARPVLLPEPGIRWGWTNPITGEACPNEVALRDMCDYGAAQVAAGKCDALAIACMAYECEFIRAYMAERHPTVNYAFGSGPQVLAMVAEARAPSPHHRAESAALSRAGA